MHGSEDAARAAYSNFPRNNSAYIGRRRYNLPNAQRKGKYPIVAHLYGNDRGARLYQYSFNSPEFRYRFAIVACSATGFGWGFGELVYRLTAGG